MNDTYRRLIGMGEGVVLHLVATLLGFILMVVGLALGVTLVLLPVGLVIGIAGVLLFVGGLFAHFNTAT